jgi:hypothetical protein
MLPRLLLFRVLPTPAPTMEPEVLSDTNRILPHCTPGFEAALRHSDVPPRVLHGMVCAFGQRAEPIVNILRHPQSGNLYVQTQRTLYFCRAAEHSLEHMRLVFEPVR